MASEKVTRARKAIFDFLSMGHFFFPFRLSGFCPRRRTFWPRFGSGVVPLTGSGTGAPFRRDVRRLNFFFCLVAAESEKEEARGGTKKTKQAAVTTTTEKKEKKLQSLEIFNTSSALPLERLSS